MHALPTPQSVLDAADRLRGKVVRTPIIQNAALNDIAGARLYIKAECLQETGSFKIRGATNCLLQMPTKARAAGVVAYSSGNHAQGVSRAARKLDMPAVIVMPSDAPKIKLQGVKADGAKIVLYERNSENREALAARIAEESGALIVSSYDDPMIIAGQGTCGVEFAEEMTAQDAALDHLICCTGGGGLISGIALGFEARGLAPKFWTAEPQGHDDWARSLESSTVQRNAPGTHSICDAILTPEPGEITWAIAKERLSGGCVVNDAQIKAAMRLAFRHLKLVVEPGGAAALAAALFALPQSAKDQRVGVVLTGGNVDATQFAAILAESDMALA